MKLISSLNRDILAIQDRFKQLIIDLLGYNKNLTALKSAKQSAINVLLN